MDQGVYQIFNVVSGTRYIGSAVDIDKRWKEHKYQLNEKRHHNVYLQRAWIKYGSVCFLFSVVKFVEDAANLVRTEQYYIDSFDFGRLYNINCTAGSSLGVKRSKETRKKMSLARLGKFSGKDNPMFGKKHSEETKIKLSENTRGSKHHFFGKNHSEETRLKMSNGQKGRIISFNGRSQNLISWSKELNLDYKVLSNRLCRGWSVERAFTTAVKKNG